MSYRLLETGSFIAELADSPQGEKHPKPVNAGQIRPLLESVPKSHRVECWNSIMKEKNPEDFTGPMIAEEARKCVRKNKLATKAEKPARLPVKVRATRELGKLKSILAKLPLPGRFDQLLLGIGILIEIDPQEIVQELAPTSMPEAMPKAAEATDRWRIDPDQVADAMEAVSSIENLQASPDSGKKAELPAQYFEGRQSRESLPR